MQVIKRNHGPARGRQFTDQLRQTLNQLRRINRLGRRHNIQHTLVSDLIGPRSLSLQISKRLARRNLVTPRAKRLRLSQPTKLSVDPDKHLLKNVFREMFVADQADDVTKERLLHALEELVQGLAAPGLRLQHPPAFLLRCCLNGHSTIMTRESGTRFGSGEKKRRGGRRRGERETRRRGERRYEQRSRIA